MWSDEAFAVAAVALFAAIMLVIAFFIMGNGY
jgi:hypothetical protein